MDEWKMITKCVSTSVYEIFQFISFLIVLMKMELHRMSFVCDFVFLVIAGRKQMIEENELKENGITQKLEKQRQTVEEYKRFSIFPFSETQSEYMQKRQNLIYSSLMRMFVDFNL